MFYSRGDHVQHTARRPESSCGPPNKKVGHPCSTSDCVIVSEDLKSEKQCSAAVQKANKMLGMIKRNFTDRSKETVMALYKSLVRPHLEYCVHIWNPYFIKDIKLLEGVQRRATKLVEGIEHLKYDERLQYLGLTRLDYRRVRSDLIETFKIINGIYNVHTDTFF